MKNDDIKQAIGAMFDALISGSDNEAKENYGDKIKELAKIEHLKDMEDYSCLIEFKIDEILRQVVSELNKEVTDRNKIFELYFLYKNYQYIDNNLSNLVRKKEGSSCCVDKSRWLIKRYREYILNGTIPDMTINEKCYWKPHFGTGQQWMNLCEGLDHFYCGNPSKYLQSLNELMGCEE